MYLAVSNSTDLVVGIEENVKTKEENCNGQYKCQQAAQGQVLRAFNRLKNERKEQKKTQRKPRKTICKDPLEKSSRIFQKREPCKPCKRGNKRKPKKHIFTSKMKATFQETFDYISNENNDIVEVTFQHEEFDLVEVRESDFKKDEQ